MIDNLIIFISIIIINLILVLFFEKIKIFQLTIDKPDKERKFHLNPTPLAGGTLIILNILIMFLFSLIFNDFLLEKYFFQVKEEFYCLFFISILIFSLGFVDDKVDLNPNLKFFFIFIIIFLLQLLDENIILTSINFSFYD